MSEASQARIMAIESRLNSTRETARVAGISHNRAWLARHGVATLTAEQLDRLEIYLWNKVGAIMVLALRGGR